MERRSAIRHFSDPGCPFAFSAERQRLRLDWLYGDQLALVDAPRGALGGAAHGVLARADRTGPPDAARALRHADGVDAAAGASRPRSMRAGRSSRLVCTPRTAAVRCCAACACSALGPRARRSGRHRASRVQGRPGPDRAREEDGRARGRARRCTPTCAPPAPLAGLSRAGLQAGRSAGGAALHLPELRDRAHRDPARGVAHRRPRRPARLPPGRGLRDGAGQHRAGARPASRPRDGRGGARLGGHAARHSRVAAVSDRPPTDVREELAHVARFDPVGGDGYWALA